MATLAPTLVQATPRTRDAARAMSTWLFVVAALVFGIVVVGGITRLTESGLSIVRWEPVSGVLPPLSDQAWADEFRRYLASPQGRTVNAGMTLAAFKGIYFWEYVHRLLARVFGAAFLLPLLWFGARGAIPPTLRLRMLGLTLLVALQPLAGWWMVASGLVDRPAVAHERLALHLTLALTIMAASLWTALDLRPAPRGPRVATGWIVPLLALFAVQIVWGAFVAGLRAGWFVNTWPLMDGALIHPEALAAAARSAWAWMDDPIAAQAVHRKLALLVAGGALTVAAVSWRGGLRAPALALGAAVTLQFTLGVLTLVHQVPVALGVLHQAGAALLLAAAVWAAQRSLANARALV